MPRLHSSARARSVRLSSFTLIELLTVIVIIAILAALTLAAASGVMKLAARDRAKAEIKGMANALESYKIDNGAYPVWDFLASYPSSSLPPDSVYYQPSSQALYQSLSGKTHYSDLTATTKTYMSFKTSQLGNYTAGSLTYVIDPFGNAYGYCSTNNAYPTLPNNGQGFFDLWSTAGDTTYTNLISNWGS